MTDVADPQLNGSFHINQGLRLARGLLMEIVSPCVEAPLLATDLPSGEPGPADSCRVPGRHLSAVHRRHGVVGRHRCENDGVAVSSRTRSVAARDSSTRWQLRVCASFRPLDACRCALRPLNRDLLAHPHCLRLQERHRRLCRHRGRRHSGRAVWSRLPLGHQARPVGDRRNPSRSRTSKGAPASSHFDRRAMTPATSSCAARTAARTTRPSM